MLLHIPATDRFPREVPVAALSLTALPRELNALFDPLYAPVTTADRATPRTSPAPGGESASPEHPLQASHATIPASVRALPDVPSPHSAPALSRPVSANVLREADGATRPSGESGLPSVPTLDDRMARVLVRILLVVRSCCVADCCFSLATLSSPSRRCLSLSLYDASIAVYISDLRVGAH